ncbi:uracil-DNA glycosylase family protein [Agarilytica rhodophyticola]|uniref:uracil-DNA glycosylase family protein n=1 Tax=Agarilytica rhodophyticola TaxID=1737490 RepID=UPI000B3415D0|nr:uracil-DNA glycosylase family protein [Agarilytica rhodophyticola]
MNIDVLLQDIRGCTLCEKDLPLGPRPVLQIGHSAKILVAAQAPGTRVHETGIPFNDPSGDRLRKWMGVSRDLFYDANKLAIVPMGFCYPGRGKSGDLPPRKECAQTWRAKVLEELKNIELTLVIGQYAFAYHLPGRSGNLTDNVKLWQQDWPHTLLLPHPSPRNNIWLKKNPWFEESIVPRLQERVATVLGATGSE